MKNFILLAMALLVIAGSATAQDSPEEIKTSIMHHLKTEGYLPEEDDDGDISFKSSGDVHYIRIYDSDEGGFRYVELYCIYTAEDTTLERVARAVNATNGRVQYARVYYMTSEDEPGKFRILFETPCYITTADEFNGRLREFLKCIDVSSDRFYMELREEDEASSATDWIELV